MNLKDLDLKAVRGFVSQMKELSEVIDDIAFYEMKKQSFGCKHEEDERGKTLNRIYCKHCFMGKELRENPDYDFDEDHYGGGWGVPQYIWSDWEMLR